MNDWTCPYCRAYNKTGRCTKCGAFFEDEFDDVVDDSPVQTKTFEKAVAQKLETQVKMVTGTLPVTRRKKKKKSPGIKPGQLLFGTIIIMFLCLMVLPIAFKPVLQVGEMEPPAEPSFQLHVNIIHSDGLKYVGNVEILDHGHPAERFYMENGEYYSQLCYYTDAELTFTIFNESEGWPVVIHELSFADKADWDPIVYYGYPVVIKLSDDWQ